MTPRRPGTYLIGGLRRLGSVTIFLVQLLIQCRPRSAGRACW